MPSAHGDSERMNDAAPNENPAQAEGSDVDEDVADVSGGAVPEQLLEDPKGDVEDGTLDAPD
jgi:hypothetical protein